VTGDLPIVAAEVAVVHIVESFHGLKLSSAALGPGIKWSASKDIKPLDR
jgi:hypothetical protein